MSLGAYLESLARDAAATRLMGIQIPKREEDAPDVDRPQAVGALATRRALGRVCAEGSLDKELVTQLDHGELI